MPEPIKALIFDAEGVVIDTMRTVWLPADVEFCARRGKNFPDELKRQLVGTRLADGVEIIKKFFDLEGDSEVMLKERIDLADFYFKKQVGFIPGFAEFFAVHKHLPAAIGTSLRPQYLDIVEQQLHLNDLFAGHVYSVYGTNSRSKPAPDVFLYAAKELGVDPANCVVFEDSPNGIAAAKTGGMYAIGITATFRREELAEADLVVDSYEEIDFEKL